MSGFCTKRTFRPQRCGTFSDHLFSVCACSAALTLASLTLGGRTGTAQSAGPVGSVTERLAKDLTWTQGERETRFAHMDRSFPVNCIRHAQTSAMPSGDPLQIRLASGEPVGSLMQRNRLAGILILQNGRIRLEQYALGAQPQTAWTTFSVTKSVTATLVGYALRDGLIGTANDPVTRYIPELAGSAYDGVTVRELVGMTSGVRWVEEYSAPDSDNVRLYESPVQSGRDRVVEYMRKLPRDAAPGTKFLYKTGETDLLGILLRRATGSSLSAYLERTLWRDMGAESDAFWIADGGNEFGGSGLSATTRDLARFGEFARTHRDVVSGSGSASALSGWLAAATRGQGDGGRYGLGWWTFSDGSFAALGIFGQSIFVDPGRNLVVVTVGAWPDATSPALIADRGALWAAVQQAVDGTLPTSRVGPAPGP